MYRDMKLIAKIYFALALLFEIAAILSTGTYIRGGKKVVVR